MYEDADLEHEGPSSSTMEVDKEGCLSAIDLQIPVLTDTAMVEDDRKPELTELTTEKCEAKVVADEEAPQKEGEPSNIESKEGTEVKVGDGHEVVDHSKETMVEVPVKTEESQKARYEVVDLTDQGMECAFDSKAQVDPAAAAEKSVVHMQPEDDLSEPTEKPITANEALVLWSVLERHYAAHRCSVCGLQAGLTVRCSVSGCCTYCHPLCAAESKHSNYFPHKGVLFDFDAADLNTKITTVVGFVCWFHAH